MNTLSAVSAKLKHLGENFKTIVERAGICVELINFPLKRATEMLKEGSIDGYVVVSEQYGKTLEQFSVVVEEPFGVSEGWLVFWPEDIHKIDPVGVLRGAKWPLVALQRFATRTNRRAFSVVEANSHENLVSMLLYRRVSVITGKSRVSISKKPTCKSKRFPSIRDIFTFIKTRQLMPQQLLKFIETIRRMGASLIIHPASLTPACPPTDIAFSFLVFDLKLPQ
ncbi:hypothetical protein [Sneathiella limimaris]|uniref:hypothetical protein n=1 Tax=Sneathiella limimaris TaxID=1964213 RepID=UPI00146D8587|nr:hypothetical protein [Sneathiella limimaris]